MTCLSCSASSRLSLTEFAPKSDASYIVTFEFVADSDSDFDFGSDFGFDPESVGKSDSESLFDSDSDSDVRDRVRP